MRVESKANLSPRKVGLLATAGILGALLAGCAESSRFTDPFGNPFESSARSSDRTPTASTRQNYNAPQTYSAPLGRVQSRPLSAPGASASYSTPAYSSPQMASAPVSAPSSTGSIIRSTGPGGWTAQGGPQVTVGQGETANVLANRYGVPTDALLRVNGYSNASQIAPGSRLTIPVYTSSAAAAAAGATSAPAASAPVAKTVEKTQDKAKAATDSAKMKFVKGPDAAKPDARAKAKPVDDDEEDEKPAASKRDKAAAKPAEKAKTAAKPAKDEDDEDEKPAAKPAKAKPTAAKEQPAKKTAAKPAKDDDEEDEKPVVKPAAKSKQAEAAPKPQAKVAKVEPESKKIDQTPTASLPPAETKTAAASESANPEFRWPARGRIIQGFKAGGNDGINIAVPEGTSVKAAEGGVVAYAGSELKGYGNLVLIRHPNGFVSAYAHNGDIEVKRGEQVKRGQTIAKSGQSGNVASPQLHFELRKGSTPVDPTGFLAGL